MKTRTLLVECLARVEGEGRMYIKIKDGNIEEAILNIFEPPRFYEGFLRGRKYTEAPDITARICGICPVAYQMSSVNAMEQVCTVTVEGQLRELRRLLYCGEYIESHTLHIFMLHAPDFLGYEDALLMAKDHPAVVQNALKIKKIGNELMTRIAGREIHPINVRVGGFYRAPEKSELQPLVDELKWARDASLEMIPVLKSLNYPDFEQEYEYVSLRHPDEYPLHDGRIVSSKGVDIPVNEYEQNFFEEHVEHSKALQSVVKSRGGYLVGPLARYNLNYDKLPKSVQKAAESAGLEKTCHNQFKSILVRTVELIYACEEAVRIIEQYEKPKKYFVETIPKDGIGCGASEAPRGLLYHRYRIDRDGNILNAKITPPTAQNQKMIERDLRNFIPKYLSLSDEELTWKCEQAIRNYDPCLSCSVHFLKLTIDRE